ncbi:MAG: hypothetical protein KBA46_00455 [Candidatus Omnitrophica bacterium]|nr:hypothetical protein [Candidatus Omnitrophota bacterium]
MSSWQEVLMEPAKRVLEQIGQFLMEVLLVLLVMIIGWVIAKAIRAIVTRVLRLVKLDELSDRIELDAILAKGGIKYSLSEIIGVFCYWIAILITMVVAFNLVNLTVAAQLLQSVILYIPNIVAGVFILIVGMFLANLLRNIVQTAANNAGLAYATFLAKFTEVVIIAFAVLMTLDQIKIAQRISQITLTIVLASLGLALALSFGLGCKDIAGRYMNEWIERLKKK